MASISQSNHLIMYKSKSGNHLSTTGQRLNGELKKNRNDRRFAAFQQNRNVMPTPKKPEENTVTTTEDEGIGTLSTNNVTSNNNVQSNVSVQHAFKERFKAYLLKKEQQKTINANRKPFVSAVPKGKFLDVQLNKKPIVKKKVQTVKPERLDIVNNAIPICETPLIHPQHHRSPINTRSKKLNLSVQLTPKLGKRKSNVAKKVKVPVKSNAAPNNVRAVNNVKRRSLNKDTRAKLTNALAGTTTSGAIKKALNAPKPVRPTVNATKSLAKKPIEKRVVANKPPSPKPSTSKQAIIRPTATTKRPTAAFPLKSPKIPKKFQFGPSSLGDVVASTAVKPKNHVKPTKKTSKKVFNESISPIESIEPTVVKPKQPSSARRNKLKTPISLKKSIIGDYESPCVQISRKIPQHQMDITKTPTNDTKPDEVIDVKTPIQQLEERAKNLNYVSPFVTIARGARSSFSKKENEARKSKYSLNSRKSLDFTETAEVRQRKEAANYFRLQIDREVTHFTILIDKWNAIIDENKESKEIPQDFIDRIETAIGQTRLLLQSKFKQFQNLINQCEQPKDTEQSVHPEDLEAFWSLVYLQVDNCNARFDKVEELKNNQWKDPEVEIKQKKIIRTGGIKKAKTATRRPNSALSEMLKAARKRQNENKAQKDDEQSSIMIMTNGKSALANVQSNNSKIRRTLTPMKTPWKVSEVIDLAKTPAKSILKTPGSVRKQRLTLAFKSSPEVKLFNKENESIIDDE